MYRTVVAMYLVFATAAGPLLCCCASGRGVKAMLSLMATRSATPGHPASCCHAVTLRADSTDRDQSSTAKHTPGQKQERLPGSPPCPCREHGPAGDVAHPPNGAETLRWADSSLAEWASTFNGLVPQSPLLLGLPALTSNAEGGPSHFLAAQDLLHAHHILRC